MAAEHGDIVEHTRRRLHHGVACHAVPTPALSLVLVVHREQGFVPELAASVLEQGYTDLELVAVDDASPDHAPALLDQLAERDSRVRVRHLPERVGFGEARNVGLKMAEGEFVWFVNTTDLVRSLVAPPDADFVTIPWARLSVLGEEKPGTPPDPNGADAVRAWEKLFRRSLLSGLHFGPGLGSALTITWPAFFRAESLMPWQGTEYVRREPPNAEREEGSPFDVFAQYDAVFEHAASAPDDRRGLVPNAMLRHELRLLGSQVPDGERREFFERMAEAYRQHKRGDEPPLGSRSLELRARLVERGDWRAYQAFESSLELRSTPRRARRAAGKLKRALKPAGRNDRQKLYRARQKQPLDPQLAVFAAYWYRGYSCNPRAIYERARELVPDIHGVWVVNTDGASSIPDGVDYVMGGSPDYFDLIARASWFVNNVNFPNNMVKREGQVHVMTHHGTPLKKMGLDLQVERGAALLRRCARWDYSVSQNAFTTPIWERVYPTRYESLETGFPRNDALANATDEDVARVREALGIEPGRRVVLYTPTHREYLEDYVPVLDLAAVADGLGDDWLVLARAHYFYESDEAMRELHRAGRLMDVSKHPSIEDLCIAADVLVTDYSSIMFDYAVLDRPIVIHAPDWDEYRTRRGTYFDLMSERPGPITTSEAELVEALRSGEEDVRARAEFRAKFCYLEDGHAAERVVRRVFLGEKDAASAVTRPEVVAG
ncbi:MAG TPA: bifunctional glycosyltransferase family 2 protein/CDP-glycerol:glycerophosphate glycerophosphotransferase [Thermoleophilaceae bacterium]